MAQEDNRVSGLLLVVHFLEFVTDLHGLERHVGEEKVYTATNCESFLPHFLAFNTS